jgi:hypothetical protein
MYSRQNYRPMGQIINGKSQVKSSQVKVGRIEVIEMNELGEGAKGRCSYSRMNNKTGISIPYSTEDQPRISKTIRFDSNNIKKRDSIQRTP